MRWLTINPYIGFIFIICFPIWIYSDQSFDNSALKAFGISDNLAQNLAENQSQLPEGNNELHVLLNNHSRGLISVLIDENGHPCFDDSFLKKTKIISRDKYIDDCQGYLQDNKNVTYMIDTNELLLQVNIPLNLIEDIIEYSHSGTAMILNYSYNNSMIKSSQYNKKQQHLDFTYGINAYDYILRSNAYYIKDNSNSSYKSGLTYVSKTISNYWGNVDTGYLSLKDSLFHLNNIYGIQFYPERYFSPKLNTRIPITTSINSTIELWQNNTLLRTYPVHEGNIEIDLVDLEDLENPIELKIIEPDGNIRSEIIQPTDIIYSLDVGYHYAIGRSTDYNLNFITASKSHTFNRKLNISAGILIDINEPDNYSQFTLGTSYTFIPELSLNTISKFSINQSNKDLNINTNLSYNYNRLNIQFSSIYTGKNYYSQPVSTHFFTQQNKFTDNTEPEPSYTWTNSAYITINLIDNNQINGSIAKSYSKLDSTWSYRMAYSRRFLLSTLMFSATHYSLLGNTELTFSISIPLKNNHIRYQVKHNRNILSQDIFYNRKINDSTTISLTSNNGDDHYGFGTQLDKNSAFARTSLNYNYSNSSQLAKLNLSGGMALHSHGLTLTDKKIGDTLTIINVNNILKDSEFIVNSNKNRIDYFGNIIASTYTPFTYTTISLDQSSLTATIDSVISDKTFRPWRGSVTYLEFTGQQVKRLILNFGKDDPTYKLGIIFDENNNEVSMIQPNGNAYISISETGDLYLRKHSGEKCLLKLKKLDENNEIELHSAQCL